MSCNPFLRKEPGQGSGQLLVSTAEEEPGDGDAGDAGDGVRPAASSLWASWRCAAAN